MTIINILLEILFVMLVLVIFTLGIMFWLCSGIVAYEFVCNRSKNKKKGK